MEPRYTLPSRPHFRDVVIPHIYGEVRAKVEEELQKAMCISITTDGWTSRATESYIAATAHYMKDDWTIGNAVLQARPLPIAHTSENYGDALSSVVAEWQLERPHGLLPTVTDNASNMTGAVQYANIAPHIPCFAHTLNLATRRALDIPEVDQLLGRIRKVVSFFPQEYHSHSSS